MPSYAGVYVYVLIVYLYARIKDNDDERSWGG